MNLYLHSSKTINNQTFSRRKFISNMLFASVLIPELAASAVRCKNQSNDPIFMGLVSVELNNILTSSRNFESGIPLSGSIKLINHSNEVKEGNIKLALVDEWDINEFDSKFSQISVPPRSINTVHFSNGPAAYVSKDTRALLSVSSSTNSLSSDHIMLRV